MAARSALRAAICVRVSPRPQDKVRYSPEIQEAKCREWCEINGHEVVLVIQDILVSGGAANRFDSIFAAIERTPVDLCVVSDLSRWTRDDPERFWFIKKVLTDKGVALFSVQEPWLGSDIPFAATITTATVESNARERDTIRRKTSEGVRKALAAGKVFGKARFGWTWHPDSRSYSQDVPLIAELYERWNNGEPANSIGRRFGLRGGHVRDVVEAKSQRAIVGDEVWLRAQARTRERGLRSDAKVGSPYRGLLVCPFCGDSLQRHSGSFYSYVCGEARGSHGWRSISTRQHVTPWVQEALEKLTVPISDIEAIERGQKRPAVAKRRDVQKELDRLGELFVRGRLSQDRYERLAEELEAERLAGPPPERPVPERVKMLRTLEILDFEDRSVEGGQLLNRILREVLTVSLDDTRTATVEIRPAYRHWM